MDQHNRQRLRLTKPKSELAEAIVNVLNESLVPVGDTPGGTRTPLSHGSTVRGHGSGIGGFNEGEHFEVFLPLMRAMFFSRELV